MPEGYAAITFNTTWAWRAYRGLMPITPHVVVQGADRAAAFYADAFGAEVRQPLGDMFWGERHGQLEDPFGHRWNVSQHLRDVPHDEVVAAAAAIAFAAGPAS
jgi:hypothetical protein